MGRRQELVLFIIILDFIYTSPNITAHKYDSSFRPLEVGDTFTPIELVPISKRLRAKVTEPGEGKGIVSSSKSPEELADKIFESYFFTGNRIVILTEHDISGLDALQALALSGEVTQSGKGTVGSVTVASTRLVDIEGHYAAIHNNPTRCQYKLLTKKADSKSNDEVKRRAIKIAEKLAKKRRIQVNPPRRPEQITRNKTRNKINNRRGVRYSLRKHNNISLMLSDTKNVNTVKKGSKESKRNSSNSKNGSSKLYEKKNREMPSGITPKPPNLSNNVENTHSNSTCRWKYACKNPSNIDTCRLQTHCVKDDEGKIIDDIEIQHNEDEHSIAIKQFRKMLGIAIVDEEIEKLVQRRLIQLQPHPVMKSPEEERVESIGDYFNNLILSKHLGTTPPSIYLKKQTDRMITRRKRAIHNPTKMEH